jgi:hypothetical protein
MPGRRSPRCAVVVHPLQHGAGPPAVGGPAGEPPPLRLPVSGQEASIAARSAAGGFQAPLV